MDLKIPSKLNLWKCHRNPDLWSQISNHEIFSVALLHPLGEFGRSKCHFEREKLEDIFTVRHARNRARAGCRRPRTSSVSWSTRLPIFVSCQLASSFRTHVVSRILICLSLKKNIKISNFRGTFRMEREDGFTFDCRIPPFTLESKLDDPNETEPIIGN